MTDQPTSPSVDGDRQYMGTPEAAKADLIEKARAWRLTRQPSMATAAQHRKSDIAEHEVRFQLSNAALLWLWHEENPTALSAPRALDTSPLVDGETNLEDCKVCGGSGFSGRGTGYDDVCAECGGLKSLPAQRKNIVAPKLSEQIARDIRLGTFPKKSKETESEDYIVSLRTHVGEGGQLSHQNGLWLLNEVERLQGLLPVFIGGNQHS
jgi:hypothetical protein